jgi:hypothetical protein
MKLKLTNRYSEKEVELDVPTFIRAGAVSLHIKSIEAREFPGWVTLTKLKIELEARGRHYLEETDMYGITQGDLDCCLEAVARRIQA